MNPYPKGTTAHLAWQNGWTHHGQRVSRDDNPYQLHETRPAWFEGWDAAKAAKECSAK